MSHQEDQLGEDQLGEMEMDVDMDEGMRDIIVEMVNGTDRSIVARYLASRAIQVGWEVEVAEVPEVMEVLEVPDDDITVVDEDEGDLVVELDEGLLADMEDLELAPDSGDEQDTWSWTWSSGDPSVLALMDDDAQARFSEGDENIVSVEELMDDDAVERFL